MESGTNWVAIGVYSGLFAAGLIYHLVVDWLSSRGYTEGYTWLIVAIGVVLSVVTTGFLVGWHNVLLILLAFVATGCWMAFGDIKRHVAARETSKRELRKIMSGNETEGFEDDRETTLAQ
jgi:hypothetical protein